MSKKLLEESTIRSFMKLANLQPLSDKFIKESWKSQDEEQLEEAEKEEQDEEQLEEEVVEEDGDSLEEAHVIFGKDEDAKSRDVPADRQNPTSGAGGGHKKAPKKTKVAKPSKMVAAKHAPGDAKLKPMKQTSHHSATGAVKPSDEQGGKSAARNKNNSTFEIVSESLEEAGMEDEEMGSPEGSEEMGSAGESGDHKEKMKGLIRNMLDTLKDMGSEYGMSMEISDEGGASPEGGEEMAPPEAPEGGEEDDQEEDEMKMEQLDEVVEKLTKRVAARLVKESKKKR